MTTYRTPGVYVEEISVFPPSVAEVETAIPTFIGYTEITEKDGQPITEPLAIASLKEYEQYFGKTTSEGNTSIAVEIAEYHDKNNKLISIGPKVKVDPKKFIQFNLYYSMQLFFANGGGKCYIVTAGKIGSEGAPKKEDLMAGIDKLVAYDEPTMLVVPEAVYLEDGNFKTVAEQCINQCFNLKDRFAILDVKEKNGKAADDAKNFRDNCSPSDFDHIRYSAAYYPYLITTIDRLMNLDTIKVSHKIYKAKEDGTGNEEPTLGSLNDKLLSDPVNKGIKETNNEYYNITVAEISKFTKIILPPSPAMAGIYARIDSSRGVFKAPANVSVYNAIAPHINLTNDEQGGLNIDPSAGKSINVIRSFSGRGTIVWGARTLDGNSNEWRYISVRRFFNMVEESVQKSTAWAVFEPNTKNTWVMVTSM